MTDHRLRQRDHPPDHIGGGHQLADQEEERHRQERLGIDPVEQLADDRGQADRRQHRRDQHARSDAERDRHPEVAEPQEQPAHQDKDPTVAHAGPALTGYGSPHAPAPPIQNRAASH